MFKLNKDIISKKTLLKYSAVLLYAALIFPMATFAGPEGENTTNGVASVTRSNFVTTIC